MIRLNIGDIVQHFKRETLSDEEKVTNKYLYQIKGFAEHTETGENLVIYQALYSPFKTYARPHVIFIGEVNKQKYHDIKQKYRFEKVVYDDLQPTSMSGANGWIPVEDELPKDDGYILLSFSNFSTALIGRYKVDEEGGAFYIGDDTDTCLSQDVIVNAWQPLPPVYEEE